VIEEKPKIRVVIADDAGLIYSDDWRRGWRAGFYEIGCKVETVDISPLRRSMGGGPFSVRGNTAAAALADQILKHRPDFVWCHHGRAAGNEFFLSKLRRVGVPTAVYLCDEPYEVGETARYSPRFDYVFSMDRCTVETHRAARVRAFRGEVYYLPPCADDRVFPMRPYSGREIPAFFLGNPTLIPREPWLRAVEAAVPGTDIRSWPTVGRPIAKGSPQWIGVDDHPKWYSNCIVGLNVHRHPGITKECFANRVVKRHKQMAVPTGARLATKMPTQEGTGFWNDFDLPASHVNPRAFEFMSCGTLVVSDDHRSELERMFPMAPRAATKERFVELVRYFLDHHDEAEEIGRACSSLVSKRHTYRHRACEVLIRLGLIDRVSGAVVSSLGALWDWETPQDLPLPQATSSSAPTGLSEPWSPAFGLSLIRMSGDPSVASSLDAPPAVQPW
jgi:Glycosyl transferases group 1